MTVSQWRPEMHGEGMRVVVRQTLLSHKPRENSLEVALLSVVVMLFVSLLGWRDGSELLARLAANPERVLVEQEYWRLLTAIGVHADALHFAANVVLFAFFTYLLYGYFGFWVYPMAGLALGSFTNYLALLTYPPHVHLVGASGLVYWMAGFWLTMYLLVERTRSLRKRVMRALGVGLIVLVPSALQENVSYRTHAIGFALGSAAAVVYFRRNRDAIRAAEVVELEEDFEEPRWVN